MEIMILYSIIALAMLFIILRTIKRIKTFMQPDTEEGCSGCGNCSNSNCSTRIILEEKRDD